MLMYELRYDYIKPKFRDKAKLCFMVKIIFIIYMKIGGVYMNIAKDFKRILIK